MSIIGSNILAGASGQGGGGYTIENSLRLRSSASAYLSRTPATAGNRKTWTWSAWIKRGKQGVVNYIFGSPATYSTAFRFEADGKFYFTGVSGTQFDLRTNQVFRDSSAWYHIIIAFDTTQATASNRIKIYVNGSEITSFSTASYPTLNLDGAINNNAYHGIGTPSSSDSHDGYLTEVNFIDGQALDPSSFGEYNADTGVWQPVAYAGTYGTNGFYLPFSDATNTTTLVADSSGNGNDWTPNNISLTAGATYDSMTDTPTIYADGGNYCTLSPIFVGRSDAGGVYGATNGNLTGVNIGAGGWAMMGSTMVIPAASAKYYFECTVGAAPQTMSVGVQKAGTPFAAPYIVGYAGDANGYSYANDGYKFNNGSSAYGSTATVNDVIGVAIDASGATSSIEFYKNGTSMGVAFTGISGGLMPAISTTAAAGNCHMNFGQRPFAYTPPTGFLPLHTGNLPDSTIVDGSTQMGILTYTGTNGDRLIATGEAGIDGEVNFTPDLVWNKSRNTAGYGALWDSVRGGTNALQTYGTGGELNSEGGDIDSFVEGGTNFGTGTINASWGNTSGSTYVSWQWKANGAGVSNTDGSITSTVSANPTSGFSIVTYTGTGANATVGHGLGVAPSMIITKPRNSADNWISWHTALGATGYIYLNLTNASATAATVWNSTLPSSTVFSIGTSSNINSSGQTQVAYCFADVEGYSKFGSYTGNGSTDGTFVYLGFRPAFVMFKSSSLSASGWGMKDGARFPVNVMTGYLFAESSGAEGTATSLDIDFLSNGFKFRGTSSDGNQSGATYIYMAFAENPFKNSLAR